MAMEYEEEPLLHMPREHHRCSRISDPSLGHKRLRVSVHLPVIKYDSRMDEELIRLGLYQIAKMGCCRVDPSLISALVERWRPETNTFHMPFGEMTVTLEDVACLWGLPIVGEPVTGFSDKNWKNLLISELGPSPDWIPPKDPNNPENSPWGFKNETQDDGSKRTRFSKYALRLKWIRQQAGELERDATPTRIKRYTRLFIMDLLGSMMFSDKSDDLVPAMYLQFLAGDVKYNWGQAVLAHLYRQLSMACAKNCLSIAGPLLLLHLWSWTYFHVGRPVSQFNWLDFGAATDPRSLRQV